MGSADASAQFLSFDQCQTDDEVASDQREPYQQAALRFARLVVKQDAAEIHSQLSPDAQRTVTVQQISTALLQPLAQLTQGLGEPRVARSFLVTSRGSARDHAVICTTGGAAAGLGDKVLVMVKSVPKQAHVIAEADGGFYTMTFVVWLVPGDSGDWLVQGFHALPTTAQGKTAADFLAMARQQRDRGHLFNAAMLFSETANLGYRGKYFQLGFWNDFEKEWKALELPAEMKGNPPFVWQFDADTFRVLNVSPLALEKQLAVIIRLETRSLADSVAVRAESQRLIAGFVKKRPEVREVFDGVVVQASEPGGNQLFGTAEVFKK
jgi:hypothetical protein